jgi:hypothetical protein
MSGAFGISRQTHRSAPLMGRSGPVDERLADDARGAWAPVTPGCMTNAKITFCGRTRRLPRQPLVARGFPSWRQPGHSSGWRRSRQQPARRVGAHRLLEPTDTASVLRGNQPHPANQRGAPRLPDRHPDAGLLRRHRRNQVVHPGFYEITAYTLAAAATYEISRWQNVKIDGKTNAVPFHGLQGGWRSHPLWLGLVVAIGVLLTAGAWEAQNIVAL